MALPWRTTARTEVTYCNGGSSVVIYDDTYRGKLPQAILSSAWTE